MPFYSPEAVEAAREYCISKQRGEDALSGDELSAHEFEVGPYRFYCFMFPMAKMKIVLPFWSHPGVGISSRCAEDAMNYIDTLVEIPFDSSPAPALPEGPAQAKLKERIAGLLERAPVGPPRKAKVLPDDIYFFQTGMASIYSVHKYLLKQFNSKTVLFGMAFHSTVHVFEDHGGEFKFLGLGTTEEMNELEDLLEAEAKAGRKVQAVWTEFPSNPLLHAPDLTRLRKLADKYGFILIVDDTVGSFCNVDVLPVADIIITSLTKSFSGYADVMAANAILNPSSARYNELKAMFKENYRNEFFSGDAEALEKNSQDYLARSKVLNDNAAALVSYLEPLTSDPKHPISIVFYPTTSWSSANYKAYMRPPTPDFTPGYGCLFSIDFENTAAIAAFYDNLHVHHGPHLGAHLTLALPYVKGIYGPEMEWANKYALKDTMIRISVGLEDTKDLLERFKYAVEKAVEVKKGGYKQISDKEVVSIN